MVTELERMGDLSVHVAKIARLRVPNIAVPEEIRPTVSRMAEVAEDMVKAVHQVITTRDVNAALEVRKDDEEMDQLRRQSFTELLSDSWTHGVEAAVDVALLGRYYERIADHAVSVASRVVFIVTGEYPTALAGLTLASRLLSRRRRGSHGRSGRCCLGRFDKSRTSVTIPARSYQPRGLWTTKLASRGPRAVPSVVADSPSRIRWHPAVVLPVRRDPTG